MKTIIITKTKFKKDKTKIENILTSYAFKKITKTTYIGTLTKEETNHIKETIKENTTEKDTILIIPICQGCYNNITQYGKEINLEEEKYVIL